MTSWRNILLSLFRYIALAAGWAIYSCGLSSAQTNPAVQISEAKIKAGDIFPITVPVTRPSPQVFEINVSFRQSVGGGGTFNCDGRVVPDVQVTLLCHTSRTTPAGEYKADPGSFLFSRPETGDHQTFRDVRFPILTIVPADPIPATVFPEVDTAANLSLDFRTSFFDASERSQAILSELGKNFTTREKDTPAGRAYIRGQILAARTTVDLTRRRLLSSPNALRQFEDGKVPPLFEDFDRRLNLILQHLETGRSSTTDGTQESRLLLVSLAQGGRPRNSESITITPGREDANNQLQKAFLDLVSVLSDMAQGFLGIYKSNSTNFTWSVTTTPIGAEIWYSRLGEREVKWGGVSDVKNQTLPKLRWTFRVSWSGCSKSIEVDPWLQDSISLKEAKAGCKEDVNH